MAALPDGLVSIQVIERTDRVVVHLASRGAASADLVVAVTEGIDRDSDVRFRDEVRALDGALRGAGYVPIEGVWFEPSRAIARPTFERTLPLQRRELLDALALLDPIARTLGRAHARGLGHGALSPSRVVLTDGRPALADLSIAAMMSLPRAPEYSAPEQLEARVTDVRRADVYALALLFIAFAAGRSPFGDDRELYVRALDRQRRPSLAALGIAAAPAIDRVLERALAVDAELRFADADALWDALRSAVLAAPNTDPEPARPRVEEHVPEVIARPLRAPASIIVGASVVLIAAGFAIEAGVRAIRKPAPMAAVSSSSASSAPSGMPSASPSPVVAAVEKPPESPREMLAVGDTLLVDRTEVTVRSYRACVVAGNCTETHKRASGYRADDPVRREWLCNYHRAGRDDHPINCINFQQAKAYCSFAGKRLPNADEWTRAARGDEPRKYAWGDAMPRCKEVVFARYGPDQPGCNKQPVGTQPADAHPATASKYGAFDMGGSLWEWTTELSPRGFPLLRGGAWDCSETGVTIESRLEQAPTNADITLGFRCVADPP